jgi:hypothetical protein
VGPEAAELLEVELGVEADGPAAQVGAESEHAGDQAQLAIDLV